MLCCAVSTIVWCFPIALTRALCPKLFSLNQRSESDGISYHCNIQHQKQNIPNCHALSLEPFYAKTIFPLDICSCIVRHTI